MAADQFAGIAAAAVAAYCAAHPGEATLLGNHEHDDQLGDPSEAAAVRRRAELTGLLGSLDALPALDPANSVDREILRNELSRELTELDEPSWNPIRHDPGPALHALISWDFAPLPDRLSSAAGRLSCVPDYLAAAQSRLTDPSLLQLQVTIARLSATRALISDELPRLAERTGQQRELANAVERAAAAVTRYQGELQSRLPRARPDRPLGERNYARTLALTLATRWEPADLLAQAHRDLARVEAELAELVGARGDAGRDEIAAEFDRLATDAPTNADIVDRCRDALAETTRFVERHELLTLFHDPVEVREMPEIDRGTAVAYCQAVGPFESAPLPTRFAVSPTPADWPAERVQAFYRDYNSHMVHELTVHEAMPGHVEQLSHARRYRGDSAVRAVFESTTFIEGWAVYAEELMAERGYRSDVSAEAAGAVRMQQLKGQLRMLVHTILEISFHCGELDETEAQRLMTERGYYPEAEANRWQRVKVMPALVPAYHVGYLEWRALLGELRAAHPDWSDRTVHDTVLSFGSPPVRQLRTLLGLASAG